MSRFKKIDDNQKEIVKALRQIPGVSVVSLAACGKGVPDLLVGWKGVNYLLEIKDGKKPPSARRLTKDQQEWHSAWNGQVCVVTGCEDALEVLHENGFTKRYERAEKTI